MMGNTSDDVLVGVRLAVVIATVLLGVLFLVRGGALSDPARRPAWLASLFGLLGLSTLDIGVPIVVLDSWLGGSNLWNIMEAVAATCSFWFFYRAVQLLVDEGRKRASRLWLLGVIVLAEIVAFSMIEDRGATSVNFVGEHITDPACFVYLMIYIVTVGVLSVLPIWAARHRIRSVFAVFLVGYALVAAACLSHVYYLIAAHYALGTPAHHEFVRSIFYVLFLPGVLALVIGFTAAYIRRQQKKLQPVWRMRALRTGLILRKVAGEGSLRKIIGALFSEEPRERVYHDAVALHDSVYRDDTMFTSDERRLLERINSDLLRHIGIDQEIASIAEVVT